jgi:transcriptional regulator with XRE-family HTH domain
VLTIGEQLRSARVMRRLTQGQLAEQVGTVQSAVSEWENGTSSPGLPLIERIAKALAFDVVAFLVPWEVTGGADVPSLARSRRIEAITSLADVAANLKQDGAAS